ncbi:unnamed protein product, partial [Ectocarpus sp. 12 AP-2014]
MSHHKVLRPTPIIPGASLTKTGLTFPGDNLRKRGRVVPGGRGSLTQAERCKSAPRSSCLCSSPPAPPSQASVCKTQSKRSRLSWTVIEFRRACCRRAPCLSRVAVAAEGCAPSRTTCNL